MSGLTRRQAVLALCAAAMPLVLPGTARAQSLDALRASGVVGERYDGLAIIRGDASAADRALVDRINAERRRIYQQRAAEQGVPADQVGRVYAGTIFQNAPAGTWFLDAGGNWMRK
jgi:uncharacterized protein